MVGIGADPPGNNVLSILDLGSLLGKKQVLSGLSN